SSPQLEATSAVHSLSGSLPAAIGRQRPLAAPVLVVAQALHRPVQADSQQTPSTQKLLGQSVGATQGPPLPPSGRTSLPASVIPPSAAASMPAAPPAPASAEPPLPVMPAAPPPVPTPPSVRPPVPTEPASPLPPDPPVPRLPPRPPSPLPPPPSLQAARPKMETRAKIRTSLACNLRFMHLPSLLGEWRANTASRPRTSSEQRSRDEPRMPDGRYRRDRRASEARDQRPRSRNAKRGVPLRQSLTGSPLGRYRDRYH